MEDYWINLDIDSWLVMNDEEIPESASQINNANAEASHSRSAATATAGKINIIEKSKSKSKPRNKFRNEMEISGGEGVTVQKLDHNAKERIRRMKLNASYLALRALLPDSRRSKKKWSAPAIVDKVLKYIPELEKEVEELRCNKQDVQSRTKENPTAAKYKLPTISVNRVNQEEAILQVCMATPQPQQSKLTHLLQCVEDEGMCIKSASALDICDTRISHHLHIQTTSEVSFEELRDKVISWLR